MRIALNRRLLVALMVTILTGTLFKMSFFQENSEVFLFPSIVSMAMLALSLISLVREAFALCVDDFEAFPFMRQVPSLVIMVGGVSLVEVLGIYTSAFLVLSLVSFIYSPETNTKIRFRKSLIFAIGFSLFMYLLFSIILNVQTPRGLLI